MILVCVDGNVGIHDVSTPRYNVSKFDYKYCMTKIKINNNTLLSNVIIDGIDAIIQPLQIRVIYW